MLVATKFIPKIAFTVRSEIIGESDLAPSRFLLRDAAGMLINTLQ